MVCPYPLCSLIEPGLRLPLVGFESESVSLCKRAALMIKVSIDRAALLFVLMAVKVYSYRPLNELPILLRVLRDGTIYYFV